MTLQVFLVLGMDVDAVVTWSTDYEIACESARINGGVVVPVPVLADYTTPPAAEPKPEPLDLCLTCEGDCTCTGPDDQQGPFNTVTVTRIEIPTTSRGTAVVPWPSPVGVPAPSPYIPHVGCGHVPAVHGPAGCNDPGCHCPATLDGLGTLEAARSVLSRPGDYGTPRPPCSGFHVEHGGCIAALGHHPEQPHINVNGVTWIELCLVQDGGICNLPFGHPGVIHQEWVEEGGQRRIWAEWRSVLLEDLQIRAAVYVPPQARAHLASLAPSRVRPYVRQLGQTEDEAEAAELIDDFLAGAERAGWFGGPPPAGAPA